MLAKVLLRACDTLLGAVFLIIGFSIAGNAPLGIALGSMLALFGVVVAAVTEYQLRAEEGNRKIDA